MRSHENLLMMQKKSTEGGEKESDHLIGVTGCLLERNPRVWSPSKFLLIAVTLTTRLKRKNTKVRWLQTGNL